jgi:4-amino-4-deoxy-L-arabinose transferase-like glycosyltransferase
VTAGLSLPNLGAPSLWDIDEGNNAEAAREMLESDNWVVPTFNYQLRVDKPALLYWLQIGAYRFFGVNEFAARLPSALAALAAVLLTYELGRRMFGASAGLIAGVILASTAAFCASSRFANPDALLNAFSILALLGFWCSFAGRNRSWFVLFGFSTGLAVLAKGPVGFVLPFGVICLFLLWSRNLSLLRDRRFFLGTLVFSLVVLPWYAWVGADTKVEFLRGFLLQHNLDRFLNPMERHSGPIYYYFGVLVLGFVPWSPFLIMAGRFSLGQSARNDCDQTVSTKGLPATYRFLWCWIVVYLVFFSVARTKLPNYILPIYAPATVLTARFLDRWRSGAIELPTWAMDLSLGCLALIGIAAAVALLLVGGVIPVAALQDRQLQGVAAWAPLGILPILGAVAGWWCARRRYYKGVIVCVAAAATLFIATVSAGGALAVDASKAPRILTLSAQARQTDHDIRVGCFQYFQPSLVFYCRREVQRFDNDEQVLEFLSCPLPVYLFMPASVWKRVEARVREPHHLLARHYDLYRHCDVVVVTNR